MSYDAEYWCDNIREPTLFAKAVGQLLKDGHRLFLELGPHPVLSASITECCAEARVEARTVFSLKRQEPERKTFAKALAELYVAGVRIAWPRLYPEGCRFTPLPSYPWQRERYWRLTDSRPPHSLLPNIGGACWPMRQRMILPSSNCVSSRERHPHLSTAQ